MREKQIERRGISLIVLVIVIIVLLVLSVTVILTVSKSNLIDGARKAVEEYNKSVLKEEETLKELDELLANKNESLPENTKENPQEPGTNVKLPSNWSNANCAYYVSTLDGNIEKKEVEVASVMAVAIGDGETVPVPNGFYYVGGNLDTGVVISDNLNDKYDGKINKTSFEYTTSLQGNQFVWIPCTEESYKKISWEKQNAEWDVTTPKAELTQIEKYGGFYVGRYEAGLASTIAEFTTNQEHTGSNQEYNKNGVPQSKAGVIPWMFVDWTHAKASAESMYNSNYVSSGLITGTQWDVILNKMKDKAGLSDSDITDNSSWGNYKNTSIAYKGRKSIAYHNGLNWILQPFGTASSDKTSIYTDNHGDLLTTGASDVAQKYHIFDMAGNLWEWTEEDSHYATSGQYKVIRGGCFVETSKNRTACYRNGGCTTEWTGDNLGFRVVLYIK